MFEQGMFMAAPELTDYISLMTGYLTRQKLEKIMSEKQIIGLNNRDK